MTAFVAGSIRLTVLSSEFVTQTAVPSLATLSGDLPTVIVAVTVLVAGSIRLTVPSSKFVTQTAVPSAASPKALWPTLTRAATTGWTTNGPHFVSEPDPTRMAIVPMPLVAPVMAETCEDVRAIVLLAAPALVVVNEASVSSFAPTALHVPR